MQFILLLPLAAALCAAMVIPDQEAIEALSRNHVHQNKPSSQIVLSEEENPDEATEANPWWKVLAALSKHDLESVLDQNLEHSMRDEEKMMVTMTTATIMTMTMMTATTMMMMDQATSITIHPIAVDLVTARDIIIKTMEIKDHAAAAQAMEAMMKMAVTTEMEIRMVTTTEMITLQMNVQGMEGIIMEKTEMDINIEAATTIIFDTALDLTILATVTMMEMTLLINVLIIILIVACSLARKNKGIQDANHLITMTLCR
ncbi:uncharacterized protein N7473_010093 [Penicillium subrubescens]|uniref:uncharacterized protein n=1 Tax=Penicillium subrubescens TaxID=1316194 RepID=UPI0025451BA9|nr:uncharacterized protein N7473_010093 [Penicillium subrubescens]KAJ5883207.1 hypothetical protein N7473_010093 [Penicillium subrubescens]